MTSELPPLPDRAARPSAKVSVRKRDAERSRKKILDAAEKMFAERGYLGVTLDEIAKRSGTKRSLILYYFSSKLGLWRTASERAAKTFNAALDAYFEGIRKGQVVQDRSANVAAWFDAYIKHPNYPKMLVMEGNARGQRLDWLLEHFDYAKEIGGTTLLKERMTQALLRDALMAIFLAMSALGPLMEASMVKVSGKRNAGLHPMTRERRADLIEIFTRIIETFENAPQNRAR